VQDEAVARLERKTKTDGEGGLPVSRLACAKALAYVANDEERAHMFLMTHVARLEDEAARESAALSNRRGGLFTIGATLINLQARRCTVLPFQQSSSSIPPCLIVSQSAEVLENAARLEPIPRHIRNTDGFQRIFGRDATEFCSVLYNGSECDIIQINRDGATYDVKWWKELSPLSIAQVLSNTHALKLQIELESETSRQAHAALDGGDDAMMQGDVLACAPWQLSGLDQLLVVNMPRQEVGGLRHMGRLYQPIRLAMLLGGDTRFSWLVRVIGALIAEVCIHFRHRRSSSPSL